MTIPAKDWVSSKIEIRGTIDRGKGMFATEKIIFGEPLIIFGGEYTDLPVALFRLRFNR